MAPTVTDAQYSDDAKGGVHGTVKRTQSPLPDRKDSGNRCRCSVVRCRAQLAKSRLRRAWRWRRRSRRWFPRWRVPRRWVPPWWVPRWMGRNLLPRRIWLLSVRQLLRPGPVFVFGDLVLLRRSCGLLPLRQPVLHRLADVGVVARRIGAVV